MSKQAIEQRLEQPQEQAIEFQFIVVEEWEGECCISPSELQAEAAPLAQDEEADWGWGCCVA